MGYSERPGLYPFRITRVYYKQVLHKHNICLIPIQNILLFKNCFHNLNYQIWEMIENGVALVLLQAIVKSLIRFDHEMVINFTDNTLVLDMEYYQFCSVG